MREIKFRAWDVFDKIMVYGNEHNGNDNWDGVSASSVQLVNDRFEEYRYVWMQYTGLKDKNGVEIYEGDILLCQERLIEVYWNEKNASFDSKFIKYIFRNNEIKTVFFDNNNWHMLKLIGNIYQDKELLK